MEDCEDDQEDYQLQGILSLFLAGYFLQLCELVMVVVAVVLSNFN